MNFFDEQYRARITTLTLDELRRATRPVTMLSLEPIYKNPGIDFRNMVLSPSVATSVSTSITNSVSTASL